MALPTIPSLPTDNLYKFLAIFGLILVIFSMYSTLQNTKNSIELNDELLQEFQTKLFAQISKNNLTEMDAMYDDMIESDSLGNSLIKNLEDLKTKNKEAKYRLSENLISSNNLMFYIGGGMLVLGFFGWYYKVQKPLDEMTQMELAKLKIELIKSTSVEDEEKEK